MSNYYDVVGRNRCATIVAVDLIDAIDKSKWLDKPQNLTKVELIGSVEEVDNANLERLKERIKQNLDEFGCAQFTNYGFAEQKYYREAVPKLAEEFDCAMFDRYNDGETTYYLLNKAWGMETDYVPYGERENNKNWNMFWQWDKIDFTGACNHNQVSSYSSGRTLSHQQLLLKALWDKIRNKEWPKDYRKIAEWFTYGRSISRYFNIPR